MIARLTSFVVVRFGASCVAQALIDLAARDTASNKEVVTDRRGHTTTYEYDSNGNVGKVTDAKLGLTTYAYDARGNEKTVVNPLGHVTERSFDGIDNPLTEKDGEGNTTTYTWKNNSRDLQTIVDARNNTTSIEYTVIGLLCVIMDTAI